MPDYFNTLDAPANVDARNLLTVGEENIPRELSSSTTGPSPTSGQLRLSFWTARKTETITQGRMYTGGTAAGATPTLCRFGVYRVDADGSVVLVAACANDTALFAGATTGYTRTFTTFASGETSWVKRAGQRYGAACLVVSGAAMPNFAGVFQVGSAPENILSVPITGLLAGQTDLPTSTTLAALSASSSRFYMAVAP